MSLHSRLAAIESHLREHRYQCWTDLRELELEVSFLRREVDEVEDDCHLIPASVTITAYLKGSTVADQMFPSGATINLVATVKNAPTAANPDGVPVPNAVTWTADQGTLIADSANPELATLVNVPDGVVTVTVSTTNGITHSHTYELGDVTPATVDFTATAA